jgi:hypothetical protein
LDTLLLISTGHSSKGTPGNPWAAFKANFVLDVTENPQVVQIIVKTAEEY